MTLAAGRPPALNPRAPERGAALLAAMLTVALVATLASAALWQQWRAVEVETAERARAQSAWVLTGALDWARLILREDARSSSEADHLAEPWAVPLREARMSTFLAADRNTSADDSTVDNAFLSGEITDLQSRLNLNNLVEGGHVSLGGLRSFQRLFELLNLPQEQLSALADNLVRASEGQASQGSPAPLMPQQAAQLGWLGVPPATVTTLQPYVTVLPGRTPVNLNTASPQVIYAALNGISLADAQRLVAARQASHFRTLVDATNLLGNSLDTGGENLVSVNSRFFEIHGRLRLEQTVLEERTVVQRDNTTVRPLYRERAVPVALAATAASR